MGKFLRNKVFIFWTLGAFALSSLLFFTSLDNKLFDLFLRLLPSLTENEKVVILTIDDNAMDIAGGFPFRRELMADIVVLLKELGVESIVFDISFLDESAPRFNPAYAAQRFWELFGEDFYNLHYASGNKLEGTLSLLSMDVDEYFAKALVFSDNSWLTLTMISPKTVLEGVEYVLDKETDIFLAENTAFENIIDMGDTKTPEMAGVLTNIEKIFSQAKGAGFVNASPDPDGLRRRVPLLLKYNGRYYRHLTFAAIQEKLGYTSIAVSNTTITLNHHNGSSLRIPRTQDGSILLKWPKKKFNNYQVVSLANLVQYTIIEKAFASNLEVMSNSGFFYYLGDNLSPWEYYLIAENIKNNAFADNKPAGEDWGRARQDFINSSNAFLNGGYKDSILADVSGDPVVTAFVRDSFEETHSQFNRMMDIREMTAILKNSFCIIGSDATAMPDYGLTTFQESFPLVGTYATVANMLLSGEFIDDSPWYVSAIIALLYSLFLAFLLSRFDTYKSILTGISSLLILCTAFVTFFLISKIYIGFAVPLVSTALVVISMTVYKFIIASREKAFLYNAFSRYIAPEIITEMIGNPDKLNLGGEKRVMTAMFTDIEGFSHISEQLDPTQLVKLINRYLTALSNIIMENLGTIDKYIGDAIVAFYGAPVFNTDHAALACRSALAMKAAEKELNIIALEENLSPAPIFTRIGINTGEMVVGNMGADNKMDYTIMGNAVNLTSRIEGVNKLYKGGGILISEYTHAAIGPEFICRRLDRIQVVGVNTPFRLYELLYLENDMDDEKRQWVTGWEQAIEHLENWKFTAAADLFTKLHRQRPDDKVAELYTWRSRSYIDDPPPQDWDGVSNLTEK